MIHSLKDKSQKELVEICTLQVEEYQKLTRRIAELEEQVEYLQEEVFCLEVNISDNEGGAE
mgnify:CR=1 FL=1